MKGNHNAGVIFDYRLPIHVVRTIAIEFRRSLVSQALSKRTANLTSIKCMISKSNIPKKRHTPQYPTSYIFGRHKSTRFPYITYAAVNSRQLNLKLLEHTDGRTNRNINSLLRPNSVAPEPEGSSPYSHQPATGPYPEPTEPTPYLPKIHSDLILPSTPWSSEWSISFWLSHQNLVHFSLLSYACHMPCPPHPPCLMVFGDAYNL
jgi:hypothetical protein